MSTQYFMRILGISALVQFLLLCNSFTTIGSLELKPRPSKVLDRTILTQDTDISAIGTQKSSEIMSIVDTFVGNRGKGSNTGGLLYRRGQVFYTAARVFADYKYVQWRCNQMKDADEAEINDIWNQAHERNAVFLGSKFISLEGLWVKLGQYLSSRADVMPDPYLRVLAKCQVNLLLRPLLERDTKLPQSSSTDMRVASDLYFALCVSISNWTKGFLPFYIF